MLGAQLQHLAPAALVVLDGEAAITTLAQRLWPTVPIQRCSSHLHLPHRLRKAFSAADAANRHLNPAGPRRSPRHSGNCRAGRSPRSARPPRRWPPTTGSTTAIPADLASAHAYLERLPASTPAGWSTGLTVTAEGTGTVAHAGVVLPRLLPDRVGLTSAFRAVLARPGFVPGRDRGRAVTDTVAALATGASCLSDVEAMTAQVELFGKSGAASDTTVLRVLGEYADRLREDGLPGRVLSRAMARARVGVWEQIVARHGTGLCRRCRSPGPTCPGPARRPARTTAVTQWCRW